MYLPTRLPEGTNQLWLSRSFRDDAKFIAFLESVCGRMITEISLSAATYVRQCRAIKKLFTRDKQRRADADLNIVYRINLINLTWS